MTEQTDSELLKNAAKAAGISGEYRTEELYEPTGWEKVTAIFLDDGQGWWNPLIDDGDTLRLAVKTGEPFVVRTSCVTTMGGLKEDFDPLVPGDDLRATRRVIVRAAAEIGKAMQ